MATPGRTSHLGFGAIRKSAIIHASSGFIGGTPASVLRVILRGARSAATDAAPIAPGMPAFGWLLSDHEAAAVATYIRNAWGNSAPPVSADDAAKARRGLGKRSD